MKIEADWIKSHASQVVCQMLASNQHQVFFVGGCVRNALFGAPVNDLDISTDARPETVLFLAKSAGLKAIPTGIEHGTVTVISDGVPYEITTFRKDVRTNGRHAEVTFSNSMVEDAVRRDFTMNALYADPEGTVVDPLDGLPDLQARRVRFIHDPEKRIQEDYLRILRLFRFHAWYGDPAEGLDADGLAAVAGNVEGLMQVSKERIGSEMLKLLSADNPAPSVAAMQITGVLQAILSGAQCDALSVLIKLEEDLGIGPDPIRRLAYIGGQNVQEQLRISKTQVRELQVLTKVSRDSVGFAEAGYRYGHKSGADILLLRSALLQQPVETSQLKMIKDAAEQKFPISAVDLMPEYSGAALGAKLDALEHLWIGSGFTLSKRDLLARL
ncbi:CCA tRNA nucleotidyltransferase [Roseovarius sp. EL26]|uniref:CCA tRNA nucleotidyltransferase n=1 Tax=Roseovarius sp. EL26 TaxID=2126672 RepID=UPI000EA139A2|nr:CCA tRNA nucleotidyltransferase [Roseovarius sp. EL26]